MPEVCIDGTLIRVANGTTVAAAMAIAGDGTCRTSVSGQRRAPFCGMGICQECRITVDGRIRLGCQTLCQDGMRVDSGS
jgi:predicted molibdopterin-dependent oxidoreductase YjgC